MIAECMTLNDIVGEVIITVIAFIVLWMIIFR